MAFILGYFNHFFLFESKFLQSVCYHHMIDYCFSPALLQGELR